MLSDTFKISGCNWKLLVFPHGNAIDYISIFVQIDRDLSPPNFSRDANMTLSLVNQAKPSESIHKDTNHRFTQTQFDWGFAQFELLATIHDPKSGFIVDGRLVIEVVLQVIPEPPALLSSSLSAGSGDAPLPLGGGGGYYSYDAKHETGMVGLKNQGATCYMNSLLQTLFHTNEFRRGVYLMHREDDPSRGGDAAGVRGGGGGGGGVEGGAEKGSSSGAAAGGSGSGQAGEAKSIPFALQRVFYKLQRDHSAVGTRELTKSFGWESYESFQQHDVQELLRVLCDNLEEKMKGTPADGLIKRLYAGEQTMYIECVDVPVKSSRDETFLDLQLNVRGCKDVYESFEKYVEVEMMDGNNKYKVDGNPVAAYNGFHDARKGIRFRSFPSVLTLQLKRFDFDPYKLDMVKINDRYEIPLHLDLDRFVDPEAPRSVPNHYTLYAVLVHSGEGQSGHYYAFIKPDLSREASQWYKFDDDRVSKVDTKTAVDDNFGGDMETTALRYGQRVVTTIKRAANAYMLVYMRDADIPTVQRPVLEEDVPSALIAKFEEEARREEARKKEKDEAHLYCKFKVVAQDNLLERTDSFDLFNFDAPNAKTFKFRKDVSVAEAKETIAAELEIPAGELRLWPCTTRRNGTTRTSMEPITAEHDRYEVGTYFTEQRFFAERVPGAHPVLSEPAGRFQLFFKWYDPTASPVLRVLGHTYARGSDRLSDLVHNLEDLIRGAGLAPLDHSRGLAAFEEIRVSPLYIEPIDLSRSLTDCEIEGGDIVIWQYAPAAVAPATTAAAAAGTPPLPTPAPAGPPFLTAKDFLFHLSNKIKVTFKPLPGGESGGGGGDEAAAAAAAAAKLPSFDVELSLRNTYEEIVAAVATHAGCSPAHVRLTGVHYYSESPKSHPYLRREVTSLSSVLSLSTHYHVTPMLFYEVLGLPVEEIEDKKHVKVRFVDYHLQAVKTFDVYVPKGSLVEHVLAEADRLRGGEGPHDGRGLRLIEVSSSRVPRIWLPTEGADKIPDYSPYYSVLHYVEVIPPEEVSAPEGSGRVTVVHADSTTSYLRFFGIPFVSVFLPNETVGQFKQRISERLKTPEATSWDLAIFTGFSKLPNPPQNHDILSKHLVSDSLCVALSHIDKTPKSVGHSKFQEKAIKIHH
jgi:ubiquitin carboxyl-terminal hydrolase 7